MVFLCSVRNAHMDTAILVEAEDQDAAFFEFVKRFPNELGKSFHSDEVTITRFFI